MTLRGYNERSRLEGMQTRARAMELRVLGKTYQAIGDEMGVAQSRAYQFVKEGLRDTLIEPAEELRKQTYQRLNYLWENLQDGIREGDPQSIAVGARILKQLCELFGIDAPIQTVTTDINGNNLEAPKPLDISKLPEVLKHLQVASVRRIPMTIESTGMGDRNSNGEKSNGKAS